MDRLALIGIRAGLLLQVMGAAGAVMVESNQGLRLLLIIIVVAVSSGFLISFRSDPSTSNF